MASSRVRHPDPPPLDTDDVRVVLVGTAAWLVGLVVLVVLRLAGVDGVRDWWLVMCGCSTVLGVLGLRYVQRRQAALARQR